MKNRYDITKDGKYITTLRAATEAEAIRRARVTLQSYNGTVFPANTFTATLVEQTADEVTEVQVEETANTSSQ